MEVESLPRSSARLDSEVLEGDKEPGDWWGVELEDVSESEPKDLARLCILRDWVSLEFIRARRVTFRVPYL